MMARTGSHSPHGSSAWLRGAARLGSREEPEFHWLLIALVTQLVALMLVRSGLLADIVLSASVATVGLATLPLLPRGSVRTIQLILCAVSVLFVWMSPQSSGLIAYSLGRLAVVLFILTVAWWTVWHLARAQRVTAETLLGAVSGYLLLGLAFATLFGILERVTPGSLQGHSASVDLAQFSDLLYFSFVTLTTVGYGDITPARDGAQLLAIGEAIVGQFYIAAVVARLISLHVSSGKGVAAGS
jgi:voltage-gated potassium channel